MKTIEFVFSQPWLPACDRLPGMRASGHARYSIICRSSGAVFALKWFPIIFCIVQRMQLRISPNLDGYTKATNWTLDTQTFLVLWALGTTFLLLYRTTSCMICTVVWTCNKTDFRACLETLMAMKQCVATATAVWPTLLGWAELPPFRVVRMHMMKDEALSYGVSRTKLSNQVASRCLTHETVKSSCYSTSHAQNCYCFEHPIEQIISHTG